MKAGPGVKGQIASDFVNDLLPTFRSVSDGKRLHKRFKIVENFLSLIGLAEVLRSIGEFVAVRFLKLLRLGISAARYRTVELPAARFA